MLYACIRPLFISNLRRENGYTEGFSGFSQFLQENSGIVSRLGHARFFLNSLPIHEALAILPSDAI
jgi:hypothetical protein